VSYELLSESKPVARKDHRCIWCGHKIENGTMYVNERSVFDGEMQNHHWHPECLEDANNSNDGGEYEFEPYGNERPGSDEGKKA